MNSKLVIGYFMMAAGFLTVIATLFLGAGTTGADGLKYMAVTAIISFLVFILGAEVSLRASKWGEY